MGKKSPNLTDFDRRSRFSRQVRQTVKQKRGKGGGGGFQDRFDPPTVDEEPVRIMLFAPEKPYRIKLAYKRKKTKTIERDYGIIMEHFNATAKKGCRCTAGLRREDLDDGDWIITGGNKPCAPCQDIEEGAENLNHRKVHLFNLIKLGWFHEVEQEKEGNKGTIKFKEHRPCKGKKCKYCKKGIKRVYGQRMYWPLGPMHVEQLASIEATRLARKCKCGGKIVPRAFLCEECEEAVRDLDDEPLEKGELSKLRDDKHECPHCGHEGYLFEYVNCKKCNTPKPLSLWDVVMEVQKSGEKIKSVIQVVDFKPIPVKVKAKVKKLMVGYDWDKLWQYRELKPEEQAKLLQINNPFAAEEGTKGGGEWDDNDEEEHDNDDDDDYDEDDDE